MTHRGLGLTDPYIVGSQLCDHLREGGELTYALRSLDGPFEKLKDSSPD